MLHRRLPIVFAATLVSAIGAVYGVTAAILLRSFNQVEHQTATRNVEKVIDTIAAEQADLMGLLMDYAAWDDTYSFVQGGNPDYPTEGLTIATYEQAGLDLVVITDAQRRVVYGNCYDSRTKKQAEIPPMLLSRITQSELAHHTNIDSRKAGFVVMPQAPAIVVSAPIVTSKGTGPSAGSLIFAQLLDQEREDQLSQLTRLQVDLYPLNFSLPADVEQAMMLLSGAELSGAGLSGASRSGQSALGQFVLTQDSSNRSVLIARLNQDQIAGYRLIEDVDHNPALLLKVTTPRSIYHQGLLSLQYLAISLAIVGAAAGVVIWRLFQRSVQHLTERDRVQQALQQEMALRQSDAKYRQKAQELEQALMHLKQTQAQLVHSEKMSSLGQLVAGIAHEINNPVNFISGNIGYASSYTNDLLQVIRLYQQHAELPLPVKAEIAKLDPTFLQEDLPKLLDSMRAGAERIHELVVSLRNFSRLDEAKRKTVDLHEGIESALLLLKSRLQPQPNCPAIQVQCRYNRNLPLIECYPSQLNQVFMNLLNNAIDALEEQMQSGRFEGNLPDRFTIWIHTELSPDNQAIIRIGNTGSPIPPKIQKHLFDPFFTTKEVGKGTGLGLAISYQIAVEHGGQLYYNPHCSEGVEFVMQIPLQPLPLAAQPSQTPAA